MGSNGIQNCRGGTAKQILAYRVSPGAYGRVVPTGFPRSGLVHLRFCAAAQKRKGFEGLYGLVGDQLQLEPLSGHIFIFSNAQRNRLKLLFWDGSGLWVCAKRLEKGRFRWPAAEAGQNKVVLSQEELTLLVSGIDLAGSRRRAWFRKVVGEGERELAALTTLVSKGGVA